MKFDSWNHEIAFWLAVVVLVIMGLAVSAVEAGEFDQVSYCEFTSLRHCEDTPTDCVGGDTPEQASAKLHRKPTIILPIPKDHEVSGEVHIYLSNSGKFVGLEFRDGHLYFAVHNYLAFLDSSARCGVKVDT